MDDEKLRAVAVASLLHWDCRDEEHLLRLIDKWQYRELLSDEDAKWTARFVSLMPAT